MSKTRFSAEERRKFAFIHEIGECAAVVPLCKNPHDGPIQAAHLRSSSAVFGKFNPGMGAKPHFVWTVPLCARHHAQQHETGEVNWWEACGAHWHDRIVSPLALALSLHGCFELDNAETARFVLRGWTEMVVLSLGTMLAQNRQHRP